MNLAIRGIEANLGPEHGDSFRRDLHPDLKADFVIANPPFMDSNWGGELLREDVRWRYGVPPVGNANFAWVQHFVHHLSPRGIAGFVLANGSLSTQQSGEGEIRQALVKADLVDCIVALPAQLFYSTQIAVCLWFLARDRANGKFRDRRGNVLFIDARDMGHMVDRTHRDLEDEDVARIAGTYHAWRGEPEVGLYEDIPGFCRSCPIGEIDASAYVLTPSRYIAADDEVGDGEPLEDKLDRLTAILRGQFETSARLAAKIDLSIGWGHREP
jgi:type I restriction enzyme M protein